MVVTTESPPAAPPPDVDALLEEARRRQRRRRVGLAAAALAAVALALGIYVLFFRGAGAGAAGSGGGAPSAVFHRGWIFHERRELTLVPYPGAGRYVRLVEERWQQTSPPYRTRSLDYPAFWNGKRVDIAAAGGRTSFFDPVSDTIYEQRGAARPFVDQAAYARKMIESGRWKATRATLDGRAVLRVVDEAHGLTQWFDAKTFVPVRSESGGFPLDQPHGRKVRPPCSYAEGRNAPATKTVERELVYEYLPPTKENLKLLDLQAQHPHAKTAPASSMPKRFARTVNPPTCGPPSPP